VSIIDFNDLRSSVYDSYQQAKKSMLKSHILLEKSGGVISDRIPTYPAKKIDFGAFIKDEFTTLFADMRSSTLRANQIGPQGNKGTVLEGLNRKFCAQKGSTNGC